MTGNRRNISVKKKSQENDRGFVWRSTGILDQKVHYYNYSCIYNSIFSKGSFDNDTH